MAKYCPDPECEFWEDYPDGYRREKQTKCMFCHKEWVTEKPVFNKQTEVKSPIELDSDDVRKETLLDDSLAFQTDPLHSFTNLFNIEANECVEIVKSTQRSKPFIPNQLSKLFGLRKSEKRIFLGPIEPPIQMKGRENSITIQFNTLLLKEIFDKIESIYLKIGHKCFANFNTPSDDFRNSSDIVTIQNREFLIIIGFVNFPMKHMVKNTISFPYKYFHKMKDDNLEISEHLHHPRKINYNRYFNMNIHKDAIDNGDICQYYDTMILPETRKSRNMGMFNPATMNVTFTTSNGITDTSIPFYDIKDRMVTSLLALIPSNFGCGYSQPCKNLEYFHLQFNICARSLSYSYIHNPCFNELDLWLNPEIEAEENFEELVIAWMEKIYKHEEYSRLDPKTVVCKFYLACCLLKDCGISTNSLNTMLTDMVTESILDIIINKSYEFDKITENEYFGNEIKQALIDFIFQRVMLGRNPEKILTLIPIYHLITNLNNNVTYLHGKLEYEMSQYWGFPADLHLKWLNHISFDSIQKALLLAEHDPVLPYTIAMYTLNEGNAEKMCEYFMNNPQFCPLSAIMSVILLRLFYNSKNRIEVGVNKYGKLSRQVMECLRNCLTMEADFSFDDIDRLTLLTIIFAVTLPSQYCDSHLFKLCLNLISDLYEYTRKNWEQTVSGEKITELYNRFVINWYKMYVRRYHVSFEEYYKEIQFWDNITTEYYFSQSDEWKTSVVLHLKHQYKDTYISQEFILQVLINRQVKDTVKEILINELYSRLDDLNSEGRVVLVESLFNRFLEIDELEKLNKLLSRVLIDEKQNFQDNSKEHFITWILWITYFSLNSRTDIGDILSEEANDMLYKAGPEFSLLLNSIHKMSIRVCLLKEIVNKRDYFTSLVTTFLQMDCTSENKFSEVYEDLNKCISLYEWLEEQKNLLKMLYTFAENFHMVDDANIRLFLADSFDNHEIDKICNFQGDSQIRLLQHPEISDIINFKICESVQDSSIIMRVFETVIKENAALHKKFDISIFKIIWLPVWRTCINLFEEISDESIILSELCKYLDATENCETVETQLILLERGCKLYLNDNRIVKQAPQSSVRKIHVFLTLQRCSQAATLVCELKELLLIKSDFGVIENIKNVNEQYFQKKLSEMNARVEGIAMSLTVLNIDIMKTIKQNIHLFLWVRKNMNDLNAVKVFVDISLTTCGDDRVDKDKIIIFGSVCTNFAPLIFEIDQNTSSESFISICMQIVDNVEKNTISSGSIAHLHF